jgi:hypothetical protein
MAFNPGDVVVLVLKALGEERPIGRVCRRQTTTMCFVKFKEPWLGCRLTRDTSLRAAPAGTQAPSCSGCG